MVTRIFDLMHKLVNLMHQLLIHYQGSIDSTQIGILPPKATPKGVEGSSKASKGLKKKKQEEKLIEVVEEVVKEIDTHVKSTTEETSILGVNANLSNTYVNINSSAPQSTTILEQTKVISPGVSNTEFIMEEVGSLDITVKLSDNEKNINMGEGIHTIETITNETTTFETTIVSPRRPTSAPPT
ncbi:unnamed protein product [Lactuca saligna]|uniref:Uncharacterized protein n=1 Tax=Lactuca saligna TaxID=75948 RepID=A0AA36ELS5_LACSI|nr:unnamed protein product [Lactuca saligna]